MVFCVFMWFLTLVKKMGKSKAPLKKQQQRGVDFKVIPAVSTIH